MGDEYTGVLVQPLNKNHRIEAIRHGPIYSGRSQGDLSGSPK